MAVQFGAVPLNTIPEIGNNDKFDEVAVTEVVQDTTLSTSVSVKLKFKGVSSNVVCVEITERTGASLTALTVKAKLFESIKLPSLTVKLIFVRPLASGSGVKVAEQFGAVPLKTMEPDGSNATFEDEALIELVQLNKLSTSVTLKLIVSGVSSFVTWPAMAEITGASFTGEKVALKLCETTFVPSVNDIVRFVVPF